MRKSVGRVLAVAAIATGAVVAFAGVASAQPELTVTPDSGLSDGDTVTIEGTGYTPGTGLGINLCADQDDPDNEMESTGAGDCNLGGIVAVDADDSGNVSAEFVVISGPFGENQRTCDAEHDCVISLGELTADPDAERATVKISFAAAGATGGETDGDAADGDTGADDSASDDAGTEELAATGSTTQPIVLIALGLVAFGSGTLMLANRRRATLS